MKKKWILWSVAILLTLFSMIWQRRTGPTYPLKGQLEIGTDVYDYYLPRSHAEPSNCTVRLSGMAQKGIQAVMYLKRLGVDEPWAPIPMLPSEDGLKAEIPLQPKAGKVCYYIQLESPAGKQSIGHSERPIILRFRGSVPAWIVVLHVVCIFLAFLLAVAAGLKAAVKAKDTVLIAWAAFLLLILGGFLFGPIMQKYAFDMYWSGFPFGHDLTDNKVLLAFAGWAIALALNYRRDRPMWILLAALLMFLIFLIPHSMFGSTLDYSTLQVKTG